MPKASPKVPCSQRLEARDSCAVNQSRPPRLVSINKFRQSESTISRCSFWFIPTSRIPRWPCPFCGGNCKWDEHFVLMNWIWNQIPRLQKQSVGMQRKRRQVLGYYGLRTTKWQVPWGHARCRDFMLPATTWGSNLVTLPQASEMFGKSCKELKFGNRTTTEAMIWPYSMYPLGTWWSDICVAGFVLMSKQRV